MGWTPLPHDSTPFSDRVILGILTAAILMLLGFAAVLALLLAGEQRHSRTVQQQLTDADQAHALALARLRACRGLMDSSEGSGDGETR